MKLTRLLAASGFFWMAASTALAQNPAAGCGNCVNIAPDGDMMSIPTSGQGSLNTFGLNWKSSHGSPSYNPGSLWMWSYNNVGEGVFYDGVTFLPGHTYCITFDTYTRTHDGSAPNTAAGFDVIASNGVAAFEIPGGGSAIPAIPAGSDVIASQSWTPLPNGGSSTFSYLYTPGTSQSQLWFYPHSPTLPQVELTLSNLRICDLGGVVTNPCEFQVNFDHSFQNCYSYFYPAVYLAPGLTAIQYHWDFGDGTSSTEQFPSHFYTTSGWKLVKLTVLVINQNGECCVREITREVYIDKACDPCKVVDANQFFVSDQSGTTITYTATGPNAPGFAYVWDFGDGNTGIGHSATHTYGSPGWYIVTVTAYHYDAERGVCCHHSFQMEVYIDEKATAEAKAIAPGATVKPIAEMPESLRERPIASNEQAVSIFPNPSSGAFTVSANGQEIKTVQIYDLNGRLVKTVKVSGTSVNIQLDGDLTGTYEVKITLTNGDIHTEKLIRK